MVTYDYELFLGSDSGDLDEILLNPVKILLEIHRKYKIQAMFFVDTIYLIRLKVENPEDYETVINQLEEIINEGNLIFPHLHGHWHDAEYIAERKTWKLNNLRYYRFEDLPKQLQTFYFEKSMFILNSIVQEKYILDSYRAGGWTIQPFEIFKPFFLKYGINKEFSVIPGKLTKSNAQCFDFSNVKIDEPYQFEDDVNDVDVTGRFTEYPISTITFSRFERWLDFKMSGFQSRVFSKRKKGSTVKTQIELELDVISPINKRITASFEGMNLLRFIKLLSASRNRNYLQTISHPKLLRKIDFFYMKLFFRLFRK